MTVKGHKSMSNAAVKSHSGHSSTLQTQLASLAKTISSRPVELRGSFKIVIPSKSSVNTK